MCITAPCPPVPQVGNKAVLTGTIKVNGVATSTKVLQKVMGFVPQDDIVHEDLTVRWAGGGGLSGGWDAGAAAALPWAADMLD